jgi:hypothetical protein
LYIEGGGWRGRRRGRRSGKEMERWRETRRRRGLRLFTGMRRGRRGIFNGRAFVLPFYRHHPSPQPRRGRITNSGTSEYSLDGRIIPYSTYSDALSTHQILIKARNFLVFQGDVETIASQFPVALTRLVEQISGSAQLVKEYEEKKGHVDRAVEDAGKSWLKRRGINGEIRSYREQKGEAERFEALCQKRVRFLSPPHLHTD